MTILARLELARLIVERIGWPINHITIAKAEGALLDLERPDPPVKEPR